MKKLRLLAWLITLTMLCELLPLGTFAQSDIGQSLAQAVAQNLEEENSEAVTAGKCGNIYPRFLNSAVSNSIYILYALCCQNSKNAVRFFFIIRAKSTNCKR